MQNLFLYNWQIRHEWLNWCESISGDELLKQRTGGIGNILHTLVHIIDVEYSWIRGLKGFPDMEIPFEKYKSVQQVKELNNSLHEEVRLYISNWIEEMDHEKIKIVWSDDLYTKGEIMRHIIAHEIHHIGQLSIWARELGKKPVSANFIGRNLGKV